MKNKQTQQTQQETKKKDKSTFLTPTKGSILLKNSFITLNSFSMEPVARIFFLLILYAVQRTKLKILVIDKRVFEKLIKEFYKSKNYKYIYDELLDIYVSCANTKFFISDEKSIELVNIIESIKDTNKLKLDGQLIIKLTNSGYELVTSVKNNYSIMFLQSALTLKNKYSLQLYFYLKKVITMQEDKSIVSIAFTFSQIKQVLWINNTQYKEFKDFYDRVLDPSLIEINKNTEVAVSFEKTEKIPNNDYIIYLNISIRSRREIIESEQTKSFFNLDAILNKEEVYTSKKIDFKYKHTIIIYLLLLEKQEEEKKKKNKLDKINLSISFNELKKLTKTNYNLSDLKRSLLDSAIKEINEKTEFKFQSIFGKFYSDFKKDGDYTFNLIFYNEENIKNPNLPDFSTNCPDFIINKEIFCCWQFNEDYSKKMPIDPSSSKISSVKDIISNFKFALASYYNNKFAGIGVIARDNVVIIDIDDCVDEKGNINDFALSIINKLKSYTEISPSRTGIHIFTYCTEKLTNIIGSVEFYAENHYVTLTGNTIDNLYKQTKTTDEQSHIVYSYYLSLLAEKNEKQNPEEYLNLKMTQKLDDHQLLNFDAQKDKILNITKYKKEFLSIVDNNYLSYYKSQSEADFGLVSFISLITKDLDQINAIFITSPLMREKWNSRILNTTYGNKLIELVLSNLSKKYKKVN
jgi:hypothetical protein